MAVVAPSALITVALCDEHGAYRRRLMVALESAADITVVADAPVPGRLGPILGELTPHVVAVDLASPDGDPVEGIGRLAAALPATAILALAGPGDDPVPALLAGARGAVTKTEALRQGESTVRRLAQGSLSIDRRAARSLSARIDRVPDRAGLTSGHVELLHQVSSGRTLPELARFFRTDEGALHARLVEVVTALRAV